MSAPAVDQPPAQGRLLGTPAHNSEREIRLVGDGVDRDRGALVRAKLADEQHPERPRAVIPAGSRRLESDRSRRPTAPPKPVGRSSPMTVGICLARDDNVIRESGQEPMRRHVRAAEAGEQACVELKRRVVGVQDAGPAMAADGPQEPQRDVGDGRGRAREC